MKSFFKFLFKLKWKIIEKVEMVLPQETRIMGWKKTMKYVIKRIVQYPLGWGFLAFTLYITKVALTFQYPDLESKMVTGGFLGLLYFLNAFFYIGGYSRFIPSGISDKIKEDYQTVREEFKKR